MTKLIEYSEEDSSKSNNEEEEKEEENNDEINTNKKKKPLLALLPIRKIKNEELDEENRKFLTKDRKRKDSEEEEKKKQEEEGEKKIVMHSIFQKIIQKKKDQKNVHFNLDENKKNDELDLEAESENKKYLAEKKYSFFNFIMNNMRLIIENIHVDNYIDSEILKENQQIISTSGIIDIYRHFTDLIIEMELTEKEMAKFGEDLGNILNGNFPSK